MALLITNDVAERVLTMGDALDAIEAAFTQHGEGQAAFFPLQEIMAPTASPPGDAYVYGHHLGAIRDPPRLAVRFKSDVTRWVEEDGNRTREKFNVEPGTFMGFVLLFDATSGELLGLMNDGIVQHVRVGATAGVACDHLASGDADTVGMIGSGGMAEVYLEAFAEVRDLSHVRVYSVTPEHREAYAQEMSEHLGIHVEAVDDPGAALQGADIVATCTDASQAVVEAEWIPDGSFVTNVRPKEIPPAFLDDADRCLATHNEAYQTRLFGTEAEREEFGGGTDYGDMDTAFPTLGDVLAGRDPGRTSDDETIYFDNRATAFQFAAVGDLTYEGAREAGLGVEIPLSWFQQDLRN